MLYENWTFLSMSRSMQCDLSNDWKFCQECESLLKTDKLFMRKDSWPKTLVKSYILLILNQFWSAFLFIQMETDRGSLHDAITSDHQNRVFNTAWRFLPHGVTCNQTQPKMARKRIEIEILTTYHTTSCGSPRAAS